MSLLGETPDAPPDRQPWKSWSAARWELYRADQLDALKRAEEHGQPTDILRACVAMADFHLARRVLKGTPVGDLHVVRDIEDLR